VTQHDRCDSSRATTASAAAAQPCVSSQHSQWLRRRGAAADTATPCDTHLHISVEEVAREDADDAHQQLLVARREHRRVAPTHAGPSIRPEKTGAPTQPQRRKPSEPQSPSQPWCVLYFIVRVVPPPCGVECLLSLALPAALPVAVLSAGRVASIRQRRRRPLPPSTSMARRCVCKFDALCVHGVSCAVCLCRLSVMQSAEWDTPAKVAEVRKLCAVALATYIPTRATAYGYVYDRVCTPLCAMQSALLLPRCRRATTHRHFDLCASARCSGGGGGGGGGGDAAGAAAGAGGGGGGAAPAPARYADADIQRFLRARKGDVAAAAKMLQDMLLWRTRIAAHTVSAVVSRARVCVCGRVRAADVLGVCDVALLHCRRA
jgi:uncharacterized membrane protein YgcG